MCDNRNVGIHDIMKTWWISNRDLKRTLAVASWFSYRVPYFQVVLMTLSSVDGEITCDIVACHSTLKTTK